MQTQSLTTPLRRAVLAVIGVMALAMALVPLTSPSAFAQTDGQDEGASDALNLTGTDNVEYSIRWSQVVYTPLSQDGPSDPPSEALLGRDDLFADNLAAGSLMGQASDNGRPLYLTPSANIDADVLAEMQRVLPDGATVNILGGSDAISTNVETQLTDAGFTVNRLFGETRIETAVDVANEQDSDTVLVVRAFPAGDSTDDTQAFADSLGASALAAANGWEILFTQSDVLTGNTAQALTDGNYTSAYVVGGTAAISDDVLASVQATVSDTERVDGATRFETAINLNNLRTDAIGEFAIMVDGQSSDAWADGFPAANLSGLGNYPVVLSNQGMIPAETQAYLTDNFGSDTTTATFAAHFTDITLICGNTVDAATCQAALDAINGNANGTVTEFPAVDGGMQGPVDNETFAEAPELVSVATENQDDDSVDLRFTFDESVTGKTPVASCFHLYSFDLSGFTDDDDASDCTAEGGGHDGDVNTNPASADGTVAQIAADDNSSVVVTFDIDATEFDAVSVSTVDWNAVMDDDGIENLEGDFAMNDVMITGGSTTAPDLSDVNDFDDTLHTVDFVFDEEVSEAIANENGFQLISDDGEVMVSDAAVRSEESGEENVVVVTFSDETNDQDGSNGEINTTTEGDTVRAGVLAGSVVEENGDAVNPLQVVDLIDDGNTDDPDLVSVDVNANDDTVTYTFDVAIQLNADATCANSGTPVTVPGTGLGMTQPTCFQVYDRSGMETPADEVTRGSQNMTVVASFPDGTLDEALGASIDDDAVTEVSGTENPGNEIDELPIDSGQMIAAGSTIGPDLVSAAVATTGDQGTQTVVEYTFDEDVMAADGDAITGVGASPDPERFFVYDNNGTPTRATAAVIDEDDANVVQVTFPDNEDTIADAVVATVNDLAVTDEDGDTNPEGAEVLS